jgi:hypothetical protein
MNVPAKVSAVLQLARRVCTPCGQGDLVWHVWGEQGADPAYLNADQFTKFLAAEMPRWARTVKQAGAKLD